MRKIATIFIGALLFNGCSNLDPVPPIPSLYDRNEKLDFDQTLIGVCAAGLNEGSRKRIQIEFERLGGQIGSDFSKFVQGAIFSRGDIRSSDKSEAFTLYIDCINRHSKRHCARIRESCKIEYAGKYNACIQNSRNNCIGECVRKYGFDRNECVTDLCYPNERNISNWTDIKCEYEQEDFFECESEFRSCLLDE